MTTAHRAFLGAIIGAIIALFAHPLSRPWLQYGLWRFSPSPTVVSSPYLATTLQSLPQADTDENISLYLQVAAEKLSSGQELSEKDALLLAELCRTAAEKDSQNAFWRQNEAVFQYALGNHEATMTAWDRAAKRLNWTDYQTTLIEKYLSTLTSESGAMMSWHSATAAEKRSNAVPRVIHSLGTTLLQSDLSIKNRANTFANAALLRDNAKSQTGSWYGYQLAENAATGPNLLAGSKSKKSFIRAEFPTDLYKAGMKQEGDLVAKGLRENDAYQALVFTSATDNNLRRLTGESILLATLPGALLLSSILCAVILLFTYLVPIHKLGDPISPKVPAIIALVVSILLYILTKQLIVSLWTLLIISLFAIHPSLSLISPTLRIPRIALVTGSFFCVVFASFIAAAAIILSTPFQSLEATLPQGWWSQPGRYLGGELLLVTGAFFLTGQIIAYQLKRPAGRFIITLARHGLTQASLACLFCSIVLTPACIYWDDHVNRDLRKIALNETAYYLNR